MKQLTVNSRIKHLRSALNLSQQEFGTIAELSTSLISKIESEAMQPSSDALEKISETWAVPMDWLLTGKGEFKYNKVLFAKTSSKVEPQFDPARDTLYMELKRHINFLEGIVTNLTAGKGKNSFLPALNATGLYHKKRSLRANAA